MTVSCFASASLDTNILIHLWKAENEDMLGKMFDKAYVYQWLLDVELRHHAEESLIGRIFDAMDTGFLEPVDDRALKELGLYTAFRKAYEDIAMFFSGPDTGEGYAIALAKAFDIPAVVTDDTKKDGPKWYLNLRAQKPFGFSSDEVLLISFLKGDITEAEYVQKFRSINEINGLNWRPKVCVDRFERRFFGEMVGAPGSLRDHRWIDDFARVYQVNIGARLRSLRSCLPVETVVKHSPRTREEWLLSDWPFDCSQDKVQLWESYRMIYRFLRQHQYSLEVSADIVIARVLDMLGYHPNEIEETIATLAPQAENNLMYHKLAVMQRKNFENEQILVKCCDVVRSCKK